MRVFCCAATACVVWAAMSVVIKLFSRPQNCFSPIAPTSFVPAGDREFQPAWPWAVADSVASPAAALQRTRLCQLLLPLAHTSLSFLINPRKHGLVCCDRAGRHY